jgi:hypothetical protein
MQFSARILSGAICGAGIVGAVIGTFCGHAFRVRLAAAFKKDPPAALVEDAIAHRRRVADRRGLVVSAIHEFPPQGSRASFRTLRDRRAPRMVGETQHGRRRCSRKTGGVTRRQCGWFIAREVEARPL